MTGQIIYLAGFMGSGKTTIGPILANTLGYAHVDLDAEIERRAGLSVSELFARKGEPFFRTAEREALEEVSTQSGCVVSLGGGTIANEANLLLVKSTGILIYLKMGEEEIFRRMRRKTDRPMLQGDDGFPIGEEELRRRIHALVGQREPFYARADLTVATDAHRLGLTVDEIVHLLRTR